MNQLDKLYRLSDDRVKRFGECVRDDLEDIAQQLDRGEQPALVGRARHTWAAEQVAAGVPRDEIARALGHKVAER